jgi:hypothetical protein
MINMKKMSKNCKLVIECTKNSLHSFLQLGVAVKNLASNGNIDCSYKFSKVI